MQLGSGGEGEVRGAGIGGPDETTAMTSALWKGKKKVLHLKDSQPGVPPVPNLAPRHYHISARREKGSLFIYAAVIARILLLIACPGFPAAV